jgi:dsRNA-specific ribonuclease
LYLEDVLKEDVNATTTERRLSTKTLADVVEALIGASYREGSVAMAEKCIASFISDVKWDSMEKGREILFSRVPPNEPLPPILEPLERLLGYTFQRKALLTEALTHASYMADNVMDHGKRSLERLEFLGDAVLDHVIVTKIFDVTPELPHYTMHTLKTGLVNADFLAFMTMEHGLKSVDTVVTEEGGVEHEETHTYLWQFMRHAAHSIGVEQVATVTRHAALREQILDVMENGTHYPWALLAALSPRKFYSDLFEAVLGAVWIDSGSIDACRDVCAQFGLMKYLDRLLRDKVHVQHPKEELGKWANSETVVYDFHTEDIAESPGDKEFFCKVVIGERVVVEVRGGINKEEIKTKAATEAVRILEKRQRDAEAEAEADDVVMGEGD